jgi:hypothetical protein
MFACFYISTIGRFQTSIRSIERLIWDCIRPLQEAHLKSTVTAMWWSADVQFMAWPLSQKQAAARAGMDESTFRRFADLGAILPTPETRRFGRGKAKSFSQVETVIAFVIEKLMRRGLRATALAGVADWLRSHSGGENWQAAQRGQPVYLRIMVDPPDGWAGDFEIARPRGEHSKELVISVRCPNQPEPTARAADLTVLDLSDAIRRVEHNSIATYKALAKPSEILKEIKERRASFLDSVAGHSPEEIDEFLVLARRCAAVGDEWK